MKAACNLTLSLVLLTAIAVWTLLFRPTYLGGDSSYIYVSGSSMEETYSADDLVILKTKEKYEIEDVIGFRVAEGGAVIHRIVGGNEIDGFLTQGDNPVTNPYIDPWKPLPSHIIGAVSLKIDGFGALFRLMKNPLVLGAMASFTALFLLLGKSKGSETEISTQ